MKMTLQQEPRTEHDRTREYVSPVVNIVETTDGYAVQAEMPGVRKEGLEIMLEDNEIAIIGHRHQERLPGEPLFRESQGLDFRRVFELDPAIDTSKIQARMVQGLLTLTLPKSEKVKPRKIAVE